MLLLFFLMMFYQDVDMSKVQRYFRQENFQAAAKLLEEGVEKNPKDYRAWYFLGEANHFLKNYPKAEKCYKKSEKEKSIKPRAVYQQACIKSVTGQADAAFKLLKKAIDLGFTDYFYMEQDADLHRIRPDKRYRTLVPKNGGFKNVSLADGTKISYKINLPAKFNPEKEWPVLIGLGPGAEDMPSAAWGYQSFWGKEMVDAGWVVITPARPVYNWSTQRARSTISQFLDHVDTLVKPKNGKYHLAGCSNGGRSAFTWACTYPDRFQSLFVLPGDPGKNDLSKLQGIKVLLLVGSEDKPWVALTEKAYQVLQENEVNSKMEIVQGDGHVLGSLMGGQFFKKYFSGSKIRD